MYFLIFSARLRRSQFENRVPLKPVLGGSLAVLLHYITSYEQPKIDRVCYFCFLMCFLLLKDIPSELELIGSDDVAVRGILLNWIEEGQGKNMIVEDT